MAPAIGILVTKKMTYRSDTGEEWSNKYWFTGTPPTTTAAWDTLTNQLAQQEKACYRSAVEIVRLTAWDSNDPGAFSVYNKDLEALAATIPGTLPDEVGFEMAGDQAGMLEFKLERKSSRGKWVYLRKYFHGGFQAAGDADYVSAATQDAYTAFGSAISTGLGTGGHVLRSQKQDEVIQQNITSPYMTTRTLKRRGKKKKPT